MREYYGKTIELIRLQKKIQIKDLVNGVMTPSTYHRFKNNEIDTSVSKFIIFLERLNIRYEEFTFIHRHYQKDPLKEALQQLETFFNKKNIQQMERLKSRIKGEKWDNMLAQTHVLELINLLTDRLLKNPHDVENNNLIIYLKKMESWTHYEVAMFSNCMKAIPSDLLDYFLLYVIRSFSSYQEIDFFENKISRILINAIVSFLSRKEVYLAKKWYKILERQVQTEALLFERFYVKLLGEYIQIAEGNRKNVEKLNDLQNILMELDCDTMSENIKHINKWMLENY